MDSEVFSAYQVAKICSVHHTTVINWVNEGKLKAYTTPGGHRRVKKGDLVKFMEEYKIPIPEQVKRKTKMVLIVDDDEEFLEELKDALSGHGFELDFSSDGFEAGMKIHRKKPDLILLDLRMPGMDGFQVCKFLHEHEQTADILIIAITVLKSEEDVRRIKECGVVEYIPKPVDVERLLKLIKKILRIEDVKDMELGEQGVTKELKNKLTPGT